EVNDTKETVELKFSKPRLRISASRASEMKERLERANLESHGYKKIVYSGTVQKAKESRRQQAYYYYKRVNCSNVSEVEKDLSKKLS
ncbi:unnamed protein product, partial [Porites lobata]